MRRIRRHRRCQPGTREMPDPGKTRWPEQLGVLTATATCHEPILIALSLPVSHSPPNYCSLLLDLCCIFILRCFFQPRSCDTSHNAGPESFISFTTHKRKQHRIHSINTNPRQVKARTDAFLRKKNQLCGSTKSCVINLSKPAWVDGLIPTLRRWVHQPSQSNKKSNFFLRRLPEGG